MENTEDRTERINKARIGLSSGVLTQLQFQVSVLANRKPVSAIRVTMWIDVIAHGCTEALGRGVRMMRAYMAQRGMDESRFIICSATIYAIS